MKAGDLVKFNKTEAIALILRTSNEGGYNSMELHVLGDVLAHTALRGGTLQNPVNLTWMSEHMLKRTAEVISAGR
tara:strand:- start:815 stop:1039 length:225 start_codon:yes stop_codon:yes gene_type:complete